MLQKVARKYDLILYGTLCRYKDDSILTVVEVTNSLPTVRSQTHFAEESNNSTVKNEIILRNNQCCQKG